MLTLLIILAVSFGILSIVDRLGKPIPAARRGQISLGILFLFTGASHFFMTQEIAQMVPPPMPAPEAVIYATGFFELFLAWALMRGWNIRRTGWAVIAFLVAVFPANVYAAMARVDFGGHAAGPAYLLLRAPFQLFLAGWAWTFCLRRRRSV